MYVLVEDDEIDRPRPGRYRVSWRGRTSRRSRPEGELRTGYGWDLELLGGLGSVEKVCEETLGAVKG
jgi:hypothetical protein